MSGFLFKRASHLRCSTSCRPSIVKLAYLIKVCYIAGVKVIDRRRTSYEVNVPPSGSLLVAFFSWLKVPDRHQRIGLLKRGKLAMDRHFASSAKRNKNPSRHIQMFRTIGLVIGLIAVRVLMPEVFHAFEYAAISFFNLASKVFAYAPNAIGTQPGSVTGAVGTISSINYVPSSAPLPSYLTSR